LFGQNDHLEPKRDFSSYEGVLKEYYENVFPKLLAGMSERPLARYMVLPSFSPEYVLSLEKEDKSGYFFLKLKYLNRNYWYAKSRKLVGSNSNKKRISDSLAFEIENLFKVATEGIKNPKGETKGLDGATYYFSTYRENKGLITGEKWSPKEGTKMDSLVNLCEQYSALVKGKGISEQELINRTQQLTNQLKEQ
jgi:hypothetical protein